MGIYKVSLIMIVLTSAVIAVFWVLGFINPDQSLDASGKVIGVILVIGVALALVGVMAGPRRSNTSEKKGPGPKF